MSSSDTRRVQDYNDETHAEVLDDLKIGEFGYKYRLLDGIVMPPYITPSRYHLSRTLETRQGDICYTSYPKSGSTWLAHILVRVINKGDAPDGTTLRECLHWVASSWTYPRSKAELDALPSPRILKSHMPYQMAVGGNPVEAPCKYIYIARNPKDVAVSYYYFESEKDWSGNYNGSWDHWLRIFSEGKVQRGDWFDHVLSWWAHKDAGNVLFLRYEDLRKDFLSELKKITDFLGYELTPTMMHKIMEETSFQNMKGNNFSNMHEIKGFEGFFRKGQIGSWRDQFTDAQVESFDSLCEDRLKGTGLEFDYI